MTNKKHTIPSSVDEVGIFVKLICISLGLYPFLIGSETAINSFVILSQEHWCLVETLQNETSEVQKLVAIPYAADDTSDAVYASCQYYDLSYDTYTNDDLTKWNRSHSEAANTTSCQQWNHNSDVFSVTATNQWDLVCEDDWLRLIISTIYLIGTFSGAFVSGTMSDRMGRLKALMWFVLLSVISNFGAAVSPNVAVFIAMRYLIGVSSRACQLCAFVYVIESVTSNYRVLVGLGSQASYAIGVTFAALFAYLLSDFRSLHFLYGGLAVISLLYWVLYPESFRWLLSVGETEKAAKVSERIAYVNEKLSSKKTTKPPQNDQSIESSKSISIKSKNPLHDIKEKTNGSKKAEIKYIDLWKNKKVRWSMISIHMAWLAANVNMVTLTVTLGELTGNPYLNVVLSGLTELPAELVVYCLLGRFGRRVTLIGCMFLMGGIAFLAVPFELFKDLHLVATVLIVLCRAVSTACVLCVFVITPELFPTSIRQTATSSATGFAGLVLIAGPTIAVQLRKVWRPLPVIMFGLFGIIAGILGFFLPETFGKKLPETMQDAEDLFRKEEPSTEARGHIATKDMCTRL